MEKIRRNHRVAAIMKELLENPNKLINLNTFTERFDSAKSTISEDLVIVRETLINLDMGNVETVAGAFGGVKYVVGSSIEEGKNFALELCNLLAEKSRIIPGNFIYLTDVMYNPSIISKAGRIIASKFINESIDCVVTVETKGIPLAYEVARNLGVQLVIVRRENKVTEGPTVIINYVSGSTGRIQNMSLSKKSLKSGSRCVFVDDFMKAGGTTLGIVDLLKEFNSELVGIGVLVDNVETLKKITAEYMSIIEFGGIDEEGIPVLSPSKLFK